MNALRDWLEESWAVLLHSPGTQLRLLLGVVAYFAVLLLGYVVIGSKTPTGPYAPMFEAAYEVLGKRYDKVALFGLFTLWALAVKRFRKDRKRLFGM